MSDVFIKIRNLTKQFGPIAAVNGLSFDVAKGEVLGFLGPNGAGKSTTMRMIVGFLKASSGQISVCGHDILADPRGCQSKIGYLPEGAPAYPDMTPAEFLSFIADVRGLKGEDGARAIASAVQRTDLEGVLHRPFETLSKGFKRRVGLAQAILHDPPVLIMDEPTDGLDPNQKHAVRELIRTMSRDKAIIISTHILEEVEAVCSRAIIIDRGEIVADGTPEELTARSRYHNAVTLELAEEHVNDARLIFQQSEDIAAVDEGDEHDGAVRFTLFPADKSQSLIQTLGPALQEAGWAVRSLYAEQGRLDEVFRQLTHSDIDEDDVPAPRRPRHAVHPARASGGRAANKSKRAQKAGPAKVQS